MEWSPINKPVRPVISWSVLGCFSFFILGSVTYGLMQLSSVMHAADQQQHAAAVAAAAAQKSRAEAQSKKSLSQKVGSPDDSQRIIVKFKDRDLPPGLVIAEERANVEKAQGLVRLFTIEGINAEVYQTDENSTATEVVQRIKDQHKRSVEYVEVDEVVYPTFESNDPLYANQWHHTTVRAPASWDAGVLGGGITVATIDSGIDMDHPDLAASIVVGTNIVDGSKNVDDVAGHGTGVGGMMTALLQNAVGGIGIAPQAKNLVIKVGDGSSYMSYLARGVTYAADNGARVANLSWSGSCNSATVHNAAQYMRSKGGVVVMSAGNSGTDLGGVASPNAICVGATNATDQKAWFSSYGVSVDLAAPGEGVLLPTNGGGYGGWSGTSFSAPLVAAAYALVFSANPKLTPAEADTILFTTADDLGTPGWDSYFGHGRVNLEKAVTAAKNTSGSNDAMAPTSPANLRTTAVGASSVSLQWDAATDNVAVTGYRIFRNGTSVATAPGTSFTDAGLTAQTGYTYVVQAQDAAGNVSANSNQVSASTTAQAFGVASHSVVSKTDSSAVIQVTLSRNGTVAVRYGTSQGNLSLSSSSGSGSATTHTVTLSGLSASTAYSYQVVATDATGATSTSAVSSFRTNKASGGGSPRKR
jgi:thermitase